MGKRDAVLQATALDDRHRLDHLDMLRGVAALLVCAGHLRAYTFQSFGELANASPGMATKAFYFLTGLGHQSVVVFFALSGFLVGGKAVADLLKGRFIWRDYLTRRLVRLWIVILPALLLTLIFDAVGLRVTDGVGYDGQFYERFYSGPKLIEASGQSGIDLSLATLVGNVFFLQTIYVPTFGSNGPLWSLANEFWYYMVFPLLGWLVLSRATALERLIGLGLCAGLFALLPRFFWEGGMIWLAGAIAGYVTTMPSLHRWLTATSMRVLSAILFVVALLLAKQGQAGDLALGIAVAASLPVLARLPSMGGSYARVARGMSEISYTLYLTHFPLLTLIAMTMFAPSRSAPGLVVSLLFFILLTCSLIWAWLMWWLFERQTDKVYRRLSARARDR